jgi:hypothetical protein
LGDTVLEAVGPPNKIVKGEFTVIIGQMGRGCTVSAKQGSGMNKGPGQGESASAQLNTASQILRTAAGKGTPLVECGPG